MNDQHNEIITRQSRTIALLFVIICVLIATVLFLVMCDNASAAYKRYPPRPTVCGTCTEALGCGTGLLAERHANQRAKNYNITGDYSRGQKLFKQNCAVCHSMTDQRLTGPGLKGVFERVPQPPVAWLHAYILNSEQVLKKGDAYARKLFAENDSAYMTVFEGQLTTQDIDDILLAIANY